MAPSKWDEEEESTPPSSPPVITRRSRFEDEEDDSDILESWDAAEDSEAEREKGVKAAALKEKADAEAAAKKKSKSQRREEHRQERRQQADEGDTSSEELDEAERRAYLRQTEQESDLKHAQDLIGDIGLNKNRTEPRKVVLADQSDPTQAVDVGLLPIFNPSSKEQFTTLREVLAPLLSSNSKKAQYTLFLQDFIKQIAKDLPSDQIKKLASGLTTMSNEKMKEEKAAEKGGKRSKAAKTKATLVANRDTSYRADVTSYGGDELNDDDFM